MTGEIGQQEAGKEWTATEAEPGGVGKEPADHGPSPKDREPAAPIRERGAGMDLGF